MRLGTSIALVGMLATASSACKDDAAQAVDDDTTGAGPTSSGEASSSSASSSSTSDATEDPDTTTGSRESTTDDSTTTDDGESTTPDDPCLDADFMTDSAHCGACGHDCLGGECSDGTCQPVALAELADFYSYPSALIVDDEFLYGFVGLDSDLELLHRIPVDGGEFESLDVEGSLWATPVVDMAIDDQRLYWTEAQADPAVQSVAKDGGDPRIHASGPLNLPTIEVDDEFVYWNDGGGIQRAAKRGGDAETLWAETSSAYLATQFFVVRDGLVHFAIAADGDVVLQTLALADTTVSPITGDVGDIFRVAADGSRIAWGQDHVVAMVPLAGGEVAELHAGRPGQVFTNDLAIDAEHAYFVQHASTGNLLRVPFDGGEAELLATGQLLYRLAMDDVAVYWCAVDEATGALVAWKLAK